MAQKHELCDRAARRARRLECEERVAEYDLHRLLERDAFFGYLHEVLEAAAIK
jgi:hypothetical protein